MRAGESKGGRGKQVFRVKMALISAVRWVLAYPIRWDQALEKMSNKLKAQEAIDLSKKLV